MLIAIRPIQLYATIEKKKKNDFTIIYNDLTCTVFDVWLSVYT